MKIIKVFIFLLVFVIVIPALAGWAIMGLWNSIVPAVCGFAAVSFWQAVGIFVLGQLVTGGFLIAFFIVGGSLHAIMHHPEKWKSHWHLMSDEEKRDFINRRRAHFRFRKSADRQDEAGE